jgi:hypothetical protein
MSDLRKRIALILEVALSIVLLMTALSAALYIESKPCIKPYCDHSVSPPQYIFGDSYDVRMYNALLIQHLEPWISAGVVAGIFAVFLFIGNLMHRRRNYLALRSVLLVLGFGFRAWYAYLIKV